MHQNIANPDMFFNHLKEGLKEVGDILLLAVQQGEDDVLDGLTQNHMVHALSCSDD